MPWLLSIRIFLIPADFQSVLVEGELLKLSQVTCEGGSGTAAYGDQRPSLAKTEWGHAVCAEPPPKGRG